MDKETSRTIVWIIGILAVTVVLTQIRGGMGSLFNDPGRLDGAVQPNAVDAANLPTSGAIDAADLVDNDPEMVQGNPKVTIVEFSDFQCPFCTRFHQDAYPQIVEEYVKTGKARFIYRDFPLSIHPQAQKAAEAAECAHEQGKFWDYHDKLFANQASFGLENFKKWAGDLGLETAQFNNCLDSGKYAVEVQKDFADGQAAGVSGTPTVFVNGRKLVGAQPYANFKAAIDAELA